MTVEEAHAFWSLSPDVRRAIAQRSGFFKNDFVETLRLSEIRRQSADWERFEDEIGPTRLDPPIAA